MEPVKKKIKVTEAEYVKEAQSILIIGECEEGKVRTQMSRSCFSFGDRTEEQIIQELEKTAQMMIGKSVFIVCDEDLENKINCNENIGY
jgi:hypothetical protein